MSEILVVYPAVVKSSNGDEHEARAWGRERADGRWEAWLEFESVRRGTTLRTPAETTQLDRADLLGWAQGISHVYLEGALQRAVPRTDGGAPADVRKRSPSQDEPEGVLDPFEVYAHGRSLLRRHLEGLSASHLRHIARANDMLEAPAIGRLTKDELVELIVRETERRAPAEDARPR